MTAPRRAWASSSAVRTRRGATPISSASLTTPGVGPNRGGRAPWGRGRTRPRGVGARCAPCHRRRCGSVTVVTSRFSGAGVHNPDVVSIGELSGCGHSTGRSGVLSTAPSAGIVSLIAAPVAVSRSWAGAPAPACASPEVLDSSIDDYRLGHQRPDRVGHRRGRPGPPAGRAPTDSDRSRSIRQAGDQTAQGLPCS